MVGSGKEIDLFNTDLTKYTKTLDRIMGQILRESARVWLRTIITGGVPVETGMAKATLVPLGRFLNNVGGLAINPSRRPYYSKLEGTVASPSAGEEKSEFNLKMDDGTFIYEFSWSTEVLHYWLSQFYGGKATPGEELLDRADEAFYVNFFNTVGQRLPDVIEYI